MTDEELDAIEQIATAEDDVYTDGTLRLIAELRAARAELALLRPAGRAVVGFIQSNDRNDIDQQAYKLIAAEWSGE